MLEPDVLTAVENSMADKIGSMSIGSGYYLDWGSVNEPDVAKQSFPSAEIVLIEESCIDETDTAWSDAYNQEATYLIRVRAALPNEEVTPLYKINEELNKALSDLKRLFGTSYVSGTRYGWMYTPVRCETIMYQGAQRVTDNSNDILRPAYLDTRWLVKYIQTRTDPSQYI